MSKLSTIRMLMGVSVLFCFALAASAQTNAKKPVSPQPGHPSPIGPTPTPQPPDPVAVLFSQSNEYKKLLLEENKQHIEFLNKRVEQTFQWLQTGLTAVVGLVALLTAIAAYLFHRNISDFKNAIREKTERDTKALTEKILADSQDFVKGETDRVIKDINRVTNVKAEEIDLRADQADRANQRRGEKYASTLKQVFDGLMHVNPNVLLKLCGFNENELPNLNGKKALWVDDDPVSIVLLMAILERLGLEVSTRLSTETALVCDLAALDLVITNMNREPIHDDGLRLAAAIRNQYHSQIPIVIFTRFDRVKNLTLEMRNLKVEYATELKEFVLKIANVCNCGGNDGV